ncbi:MAG: hypothetical protein GX542_12165 [Rhodococcus sp.]|nr:hypothetical protein [Rhodococcus sp. (in: high G+C Gram-positive bacteria)]
MLWQFGKRVVYVLGASIFVTVSVMAVWSRENAVEFAEIGSCVTADTLGYGASGRQANCDDPDALYVVATKPNRSSDCPASGYASFVLNQAKSTRVYMCLAPNLEVGRCYADVGATTSVIDEVACPRPLGEPPIDQLAQETGEGPDLPSEDPYSDDSYGDDSYNGHPYSEAQGTGAEFVSDTWPGDSIEVVQRLNDAADTAACPDGTTALVYPEPGLTYCVYGTVGAPPLPVA